MQLLIRYITRKPHSGVGHSDHELETRALGIGRGSDADLFLSDLHVALHHAVLRQGPDGRFTIHARTPSGVRINGRTVQNARVRPGDTIGVGMSSLHLKRPDDGHDLVIEVEEARADAGETAGVGAITLREAGLRCRPWAWAAFLVILVLGAGVPFGHIFSEQAERRALAHEAAPDERASPGLGSQLVMAVPWTLAGGDRIWEPGTMSRPHRFFGRDCSQCHQQPFERVTASACLECHEGQPHHADDADLMQVSGMSEQRCASCHREHSGLDAMVETDKRLCTDCHARPHRNMPEADLQAVTGFHEDGHPEFRVQVVTMSDDGTAAWQRIRMTESPSEDSGLAFSHAAHLREEGIRGPNGRETLTCADCHQPEPRGVAMKPIRFEQACQRCHQLDFDAGAPDRQLPHGDPEMVTTALEEYYARVALEGGYTHAEADPPEIVRRRRPGGEALGADEREVALDWAREWAGAVASEVFEYRSCSTCHEVERRPEAPSGWHVSPVALNRDWFPALRFNHDRHRRMDCTTCHAAEDSEHASDVLMPDMATCLECHGDADSRARVASTCADCHGFHTADKLTMDAFDPHMQAADGD